MLRFLISNFRRVLNLVCILLGISPASDCYMPTFRNTISSIFKPLKMELVPPLDHEGFLQNNNNNIYLLQLDCHPVAVVILHVYKM